jgi:excisionase family DNA binding protein
MMSDDMNLLKLNETAELLGLSYDAVRRMVHAGELPRVKLFKRYWVPRGRLIEWLNTQAEEPEKD